jgi:hypothetical protein
LIGALAGCVGRRSVIGLPGRRRLAQLLLRFPYATHALGQLLLRNNKVARPGNLFAQLSEGATLLRVVAARQSISRAPLAVSQKSILRRLRCCRTQLTRQLVLGGLRELIGLVA